MGYPHPDSWHPKYGQPPQKIFQKNRYSRLTDSRVIVTHPEIPSQVNDLTEFINKSSIALVMCHGCQVKRPINAEYAAYVMNGIESCRFCREGNE